MKWRSIKSPISGNQVLRFSKSGYASVVVSDVHVLPGQTTPVNGNLRPEFYEMEEYQVTDLGQSSASFLQIWLRFSGRKRCPCLAGPNHSGEWQPEAGVL